MAKFDKVTVLNKIGQTAMVPVFYHKDIETAKQVIQAEYVKRQVKEQANVDTGDVLPDQEPVPQSDQSITPDV